MFLKLRGSIAWMLLMSVHCCTFLACERFDLKSSDEKKIEAAWKRNEFVVEGALSGKEYLEEDYWGAIIFFQRLTGIRIDSRLEYDGAAPGLRAEKDLQGIKEWYRKNHEKLCWNHKRGVVELCAHES